MAISIQQAKNLTPGTILYHALNKNKKGEPQKWKVTSVKVWKTRPNEVEVRLKHGLKHFDRLREYDLNMVCLFPEQTL